ncbi:hypothetical protein C7H73_05850 [Pulveribacter suum]|uniref:Toxin CptA n=2 Tax=Pulveribacter suum TaxID=2116657 RepID=A0A2P1NJI3_9BURK|nr:hypothetical protein C7H73_05850 [Pulveribacter suum]
MGSAAGLLAIGCWLAWGLGNTHQIARGAAGLLLWLGCTAAAWHWQRSLPRGQLHWNGADWQLQRSGAVQPEQLAGRPEVRLDLQFALLLQARTGQGRPCWLWLHQGAAPPLPGAWPAIRRALYSRAPAAPAQPSTDEAAS